MEEPNKPHPRYPFTPTLSVAIRRSCKPCWSDAYPILEELVRTGKSELTQEDIDLMAARKEHTGRQVMAFLHTLVNHRNAFPEAMRGNIDELKSKVRQMDAEPGILELVASLGLIKEFFTTVNIRRGGRTN